MTSQELTYSLTAASSSSEEGTVTVGTNTVAFGATSGSTLPSPAELLVSAFAACCLKNVERFSTYMKYTYDHAEIQVTATRQDAPPMIRAIEFELVVYTAEKINGDLLLRNLKKFGTIYNTLDAVCEIAGRIELKEKGEE